MLWGGVGKLEENRQSRCRNDRIIGLHPGAPPKKQAAEDGGERPHGR